MTLAVEYLARVGLASLGGDPAEAIRALLTDGPEAVPGREGVRYLQPITWPDRVPGLVTWSGQQTLARLIRDTQRALREALPTAPQPLDPLTLRAPKTGASGLDPLACPDPIDAGFSPARLGIAVMQRPALELLAIVGLETVPLLSFGRRQCGFVHAGQAWRFSVTPRGEHGYYQWGSVTAWTTAVWTPTAER